MVLLYYCDWKMFTQLKCNINFYCWSTLITFISIGSNFTSSSLTTWITSRTNRSTITFSTLYTSWARTTMWTYRSLLTTTISVSLVTFSTTCSNSTSASNRSILPIFPGEPLGPSMPHFPVGPRLPMGSISFQTSCSGGSSISLQSNTLCKIYHLFYPL